MAWQSLGFLVKISVDSDKRNDYKEVRNAGEKLQINLNV